MEAFCIIGLILVGLALAHDRGLLSIHPRRRRRVVRRRR
jgi:hypothetical protein